MTLCVYFEFVISSPIFNENKQIVAILLKVISYCPKWMSTLDHV
jgi:hypothetical protein